MRKISRSKSFKINSFTAGIGNALIKTDAARRATRRRYKEMKTGEMAKKGLYTGVGAGLMLFALAGLLPGSFIGGVIGLNIAGGIFGFPVTASVLPRIIVAVSMLMGVILSGVAFVVGGALTGWLTGHFIDALRERKTMTIGHSDSARIK